MIGKIMQNGHMGKNRDLIREVFVFIDGFSIRWNTVLCSII